MVLNIINDVIKLQIYKTDFHAIFVLIDHFIRSILINDTNLGD